MGDEGVKARGTEGRDSRAGGRKRRMEHDGDKEKRNGGERGGKCTRKAVYIEEGRRKGSDGERRWRERNMREKRERGRREREAI